MIKKVCTIHWYKWIHACSVHAFWVTLMCSLNDWLYPVSGLGRVLLTRGTRLAQNDKHEYAKNIVLEYWFSNTCTHMFSTHPSPAQFVITIHSLQYQHQNVIMSSSFPPTALTTCENMQWFWWRCAALPSLCFCLESCAKGINTTGLRLVRISAGWIN